MNKMTLVEKMERAGSPKSWITEVRQKEADHRKMEGRINELLDIVHNLATERDQLMMSPEERAAEALREAIGSSQL